MALVPSPGLQIDIFVTNFTPLPPTLSTTFPSTTSSSHTVVPFDSGKDGELSPPLPVFARHGHSSPSGSSSEFSDGEDSNDTYVDLNGDVSNQEFCREDRESQEFAAEHILDLTNFDGDYDIVMPAELALNRSVKKQGKLRRARTRKAAKMSLAAKQKLHTLPTATENSRDVRPASHVRIQSTDATFPTDMFLPYVTPGIGHRLSTALEVDPTDPVASYSESQFQSPPITPRTSHYGTTEGLLHTWDAKSDITSVRDIVPRLGLDTEDVTLEIEDQEMHDVNVISEHARPGKPKLDRVIADEVDICEGSMMVACEYKLHFIFPIILILLP